MRKFLSKDLLQLNNCFSFLKFVQTFISKKVSKYSVTDLQITNHPGCVLKTLFCVFFFTADWSFLSVCRFLFNYGISISLYVQLYT